MLIGVVNQELLQHNGNRSYPLSEQATKLPIVGGADFTIPNNFLVAAKIVISATPDIVNVSNFYISRLTVYNGGVNIVISYYDENATGGASDLIVGTVAAADRGELNTTFPIIGLNRFYGLAGHVTIGTFEQVRIHLGDWQFNRFGSRFDADVINYSAAAVTSITLVENGVTHLPIYGDIKIEAGENIELHEEHDYEGHTVIKIGRRADDPANTGRCIKTINLVSPTEDGNIDIVSHSPCLQVSEATYSLILTETCCDPCCGCEELSSINQNISNIIQANNEIRMYQQRLEHQLNGLAATLGVTGV